MGNYHIWQEGGGEGVNRGREKKKVSGCRFFPFRHPLVINALLGTDEMVVGHSLKSCTVNLRHAFIPISNRSSLEGRRIVIVDTPGFDDTYTDDQEILRRIAVWLASS
jgi:hypothetical protein